jgi:hypothetical protein
MEYVPADPASCNAALYVRFFIILDKWAGIRQPAGCESMRHQHSVWVKEKERGSHGKYDNTD